MILRLGGGDKHIDPMTAGGPSAAYANRVRLDGKIGAPPPRWHTPRSAYIHVPFCRTMCAYCDFATFAGVEQHIPAYVASLADEIRIGSPGANPDVPLETMYLGGGTPSLLEPAQLETIITAIATRFGARLNLAEVTLEANPGFNPALIGSWVNLGVNRVSLGVQSLDDPTLKRLGRTHDAETAIRAVEALKACGSISVNLDLIYGLPWQTLEMWQEHLKRALETEPDHVSLYALAIEVGTPLASQVSSGQWSVPDDDLVADMYDVALPELTQAGFRHYEVSNWAKPGHESRHNLAYWRNEAYHGFGVGAHRYIDGRRSWNVRSLDHYLAAMQSGRPVEEGSETLGPDATPGETAMLALRMRDEGIDFARFIERFGIDPRERWRTIFDEVAPHGFLRVDDSRACLTDRGLLASNDIASRFL
ncbi:MAG: radical SAM family heme chaperone HemW [Chloroflexi bacterium]|nr:radical SAM family heme chaperone HemW [Chloroflexota bacterium]